MHTLHSISKWTLYKQTRLSSSTAVQASSIFSPSLYGYFIFLSCYHPLGVSFSLTIYSMQLFTLLYPDFCATENIEQTDRQTDRDRDRDREIQRETQRDRERENKFCSVSCTNFDKEMLNSGTILKRPWVVFAGLSALDYFSSPPTLIYILN